MDDQAYNKYQMMDINQRRLDSSELADHGWM